MLLKVVSEVIIFFSLLSVTTPDSLRSLPVSPGTLASQNRDKNWTTLLSPERASSQPQVLKGFAISLKNRAEGTRFELATPCGALHFQ